MRSATLILGSLQPQSWYVSALHQHVIFWQQLDAGTGHRARKKCHKAPKSNTIRLYSAGAVWNQWWQTSPFKLKIPNHRARKHFARRQLYAAARTGNIWIWGRQSLFSENMEECKPNSSGKPSLENTCRPRTFVKKIHWFRPPFCLPLILLRLL